MNVSTIVKYSLLTALVIFVGMFLHYNLPRTDVVQFTGTDVKRMDRKDPNSGSSTRDVRYLNAITRTGKIRVFRNEDTGWGWPPYFKFNSADLSAEAQSLMQNPGKPWARVRYYGWRIKMRFFRILMERLGRSERYQVITQSVRDRTGHKLPRFVINL